VVAAVADFLEQMPVDHLHFHWPRIDRFDLSAQVFGMALQHGVVNIGVQLWVFVARDQ